MLVLSQLLESQSQPLEPYLACQRFEVSRHLPSAAPLQASQTTPAQTAQFSPALRLAQTAAPWCRHTSTPSRLTSTCTLTGTPSTSRAPLPTRHPCPHLTCPTGPFPAGCSSKCTHTPCTWWFGADTDTTLSSRHQANQLRPAAPHSTHIPYSWWGGTHCSYTSGWEEKTLTGSRIWHHILLTHTQVSPVAALSPCNIHTGQATGELVQGSARQAD